MRVRLIFAVVLVVGAGLVISGAMDLLLSARRVAPTVRASLAPTPMVTTAATATPDTSPTPTVRSTSIAHHPATPQDAELLGFEDDVRPRPRPTSHLTATSVHITGGTYDWERGPFGWTGTGLWRLTTRRSDSPNHSWWYGREDTGTYDTGATTMVSLVALYCTNDHRQYRRGCRRQ